MRARTLGVRCRASSVAAPVGAATLRLYDLNSATMRAAVSAAPLFVPVECAAASTGRRADERALLVADRTAHACAERRAAEHCADGTRARLEVPPCGLAVEGVERAAARADGCALLAADQCAGHRPATDNGRRARLTPEARAMPPLLRRQIGRERGQQEHEAGQ